MPEKHDTIRKQERFASWAILVILAGIATGIFIARFRDNPANRIVTISKSSSPVEARSGGTIVPVPDTLTPLTAPEQFDSASLSDKIDGKAELYLSAGFETLRCQRFSEKGKPDSWLEVFVFRMRDAPASFSVFGVQRRDGSQALDFAPFSYRTPNAVYLSHGSHYLELIAATPSEILSQGMLTILGNFVRENPTEKTVMSEPDLFPKTGLIEGSVVLMASDVFGYEALNNVFAAKYKLDNIELTAFLSRRATPDEAAKLAEGFHGFLTNFGGKDVGTADMKLVEIMDNYDVMFGVGNFFAGIHECPNKETALKLAGMLKQKLEEAGR